MALRTAATRSMLLGEAQRRADFGVDTVLVSQYGACSETCLPWQGKVYIDDVWGVWDGERSGDRGLSNDGHWYMLLSVAVNKGLFHPNCRHTLLTWRYGDPIPPPMDGDKIRNTAALEQQQRGLEREVRKWKRMVEGTLDEVQKKAYQQKARDAQKTSGNLSGNMRMCCVGTTGVKKHTEYRWKIPKRCYTECRDQT